LANKLGYNFKVFSDAGLSGTIPFNKRPGLNELLNQVIEKKIQAIFVADLDRLSRGDIIQTTIIKNIIKDNKAKLFEVEKEIDLNDINQELLSDIRSLRAAFEIKKTSGRIKSVLENNAQIGKAGGGPLLAFGYTKDSAKMLIINEEEKEIVELIYHLALEGKGTKSIATILNEKGILTKRGRSTTGKTLLVKGKKKDTFLWRDAVVYRILTNPIYMGKRIFKGKTYDCPAIVPEKTFNLVKEKLATRDQFKSTTNRYTFLLKGLINCSVCKGKFRGHKRENGRDNAYVCNSARYEFCGNRGISIDYLDNLIIESILDLENIVDKSFKRVSTHGYYNNKRLELERIQKAIKTNNDGLNNLLDITQKAGIDPQNFKDRFQRLQKTLDDLKKKEQLVIKNIGVINEHPDVINYAKSLVKDFKKITDLTEKINFIRNLISEIWIRWDEEELNHWIGIQFRIDKLQNYQFAKQVLVNRTGVKNHKRLTKIISEEVMIAKSVNSEEGFLRTDGMFSARYLS
jgi:DNA invertase Pin-like site-specific DNA recombinase